MKHLLVLLTLVLIWTATSAQDKVAKFDFKTEEIDFGEIAKGSDGIRSFEFTNIGTAPLIISKVYSSCGCTVPKKPEKPVMPGQTGLIEVEYDTDREGPIRKTITVYSNAEETTKALKIKGKVFPEGQAPAAAKSLLFKDKALPVK